MLFKNKFRIPSARLQNWNYGNDGAYFITICTQNRENFFGKITDHTMFLNSNGLLAEKLWASIPTFFPFIELGNFVIMPNHIHGILIIEQNYTQPTVDKTLENSENQLITNQFENKTNEKTKILGGITGTNNPMLSDNISKIIRWYKAKCTIEIRKSSPLFGWQSRFHDHIIRDADSFERIQTYIENNPSQWDIDKFYIVR